MICANETSEEVGEPADNLNGAASSGFWGLRLAGQFITPPISSVGQRLSSSASTLAFLPRFFSPFWLLAVTRPVNPESSGTGEYSAPSHVADKLTKSLNRFPVGEFNHRFRIGGTFCYPHDQTNYLTVQQAVFFIINFTGEDGQFLRLPGDLFQELSKIRIGIRLILFRLACDNVDGEKRINLAVQKRFKLISHMGAGKRYSPTTNWRKLWQESLSFTRISEESFAFG